MQVICLEETAFYALIEQVVSRLKESKDQKDDKWISGKDAMELLKIKSKTKVIMTVHKALRMGRSIRA